jgi:hypothetical protein
VEEFERLVERLSDEHSENIARLVRIEQAALHLDECLDDLKKKLFGNGQPGVLQLLDKRISAIEKWMWRCIGIISAGMGLIYFGLTVYQIAIRK